VYASRIIFLKTGYNLFVGEAMQSKLMSNTEQPIGTDDSIAKISGNTVEIFGQRFPLERPHYFKPTGELESFAIEPAEIIYQGRTIPIGLRVLLYKSGKFHGACTSRYAYVHKEQTFQISGGVYFYPSGNLERFTVGNKTETNFIIEGQKLILYKWDTIAFYEDSGLPKKVWRRHESCFQEKRYNIIEISETGEITARLYEEMPSLP
jgi:hypothetical protein